MFPAGEPFGEGRLLAVISPEWAGLDFRQSKLENADDASSQILDDIAFALSDERNSEDFEGWALSITPYRIAPRNYQASD